MEWLGWEGTGVTWSAGNQLLPRPPHRPDVSVPKKIEEEKQEQKSKLVWRKMKDVYRVGGREKREWGEQGEVYFKLDYVVWSSMFVDYFRFAEDDALTLPIHQQLHERPNVVPPQTQRLWRLYIINSQILSVSIRSLLVLLLLLLLTLPPSLPPRYLP